MPVRQPDTIRFDPNRGVVVEQSYEAAGLTTLNQIAIAYQAAGWQYNFTPSGTVSRIVSSASGPAAGQPETTTDTWQILANEIQKDVKEHPTFLAMEESYPGTIGYVVRDVDLYNSGQSPGSPAPDAGATADASKLFHLLKRGATHYALSQYVLKHTTNVSNRYGVNISDVNIEKLYTTTQLLAEVTSGALWTFPMPPRLVYKLQAIPSATARTNYLWSWRKLASTETTTANNRVEISTEYWLEQWSTILYTAVT